MTVYGDGEMLSGILGFEKVCYLKLIHPHPLLQTNH